MFFLVSWFIGWSGFWLVGWFVTKARLQSKAGDYSCERSEIGELAVPLCPGFPSERLNTTRIFGTKRPALSSKTIL